MAQPTKPPSGRDRAHEESWEGDRGAIPGESSEDRLRRMQMQLSSASRTGTGTGRHWGVTKEIEPAKRRAGVPVVGLVVTAVFAAGIVTALVKLATGKPTTDTLPKPPAEAEAQPDLLLLAEATAAPEETEVVSLGTWVDYDAPECAPVTAWIDRFLATPPGPEKWKLLRQVSDLDRLLAEHSEDSVLAAMDPQRLATKIFFSENGIITTDINILGFGFRPIVLVPGQSEGEYQLDLESFVGHNDFDWESLEDALVERQELTVRAIAWVNPSLAAKVPGDVILTFRNPALTQTYHAHLSIVDIREYYMIGWLREGIPLAFTLKLIPDDTLFGPVIRVSDIIPNSWYISDGGVGLKVTP